MKKQSKKSKEIADLVIGFYQEEDGYIPKVICAYGHPDMVHKVLEKTNHGVSKQNADYGWGTRQSRGVARINNALRQDSRFRECRVRGIRSMVGFEFLGTKAIEEDYAEIIELISSKQGGD